MLFKRNQVEDAISALLEPNARQPSGKLRSRIKRLLEIDRAFGGPRRLSNSGLDAYAFFSDAPPGRGLEIEFSEYEAFALLIGLQLMAHGWTQELAVTILRRTRIELERHHANILKLCRAGKASELSFESDAPLLTIITAATPDDGVDAFASSVCAGYRNAIRWTSKLSRKGHGFSIFELPSHAQKLASQLAQTEPRHRGRSSSK